MSPYKEFYFEPTPEDEVHINAWRYARIPCPEGVRPQNWPDKFVCKVSHDNIVVLAIAEPNRAPELGMGFLTIHTKGVDSPFSTYNSDVLGNTVSGGWEKLGTKFHDWPNYSHVSCGGSGDGSHEFLAISRQDSRNKLWEKGEGWRYMSEMERDTTPELRVAGLARGIESDLGGVLRIEPISLEEAGTFS